MKHAVAEPAHALARRGIQLAAPPAHDLIRTTPETKPDETEGRRGGAGTCLGRLPTGHDWTRSLPGAAPPSASCCAFIQSGVYVSDY